MARMLQNPFAFYRGTAGLMALDLSDDAHSGIQVICCGDAHISNFGFYASPERRLVFDLNDFDEAAAAPWEWDLKRLVASAIIGGRHAGYDEAHIARHGPAKRCSATPSRSTSSASCLRRIATSCTPGGPYARQRLDKAAQQALDAAVKAAEQAHRASAPSNARPNADPTASSASSTTRRRWCTSSRTRWSRSQTLVERYGRTVGVDIELVLSQYEPLDVVQRVVGVGSVGTRCFLHLMAGRRR